MVSLLILAGCVTLSRAGGPSSDLQNILKLFPGYHVLTLSERDSETRALVVQRYPKMDPSVVHADFDGDGNPDYALLLKNDQTAATKLVVLLCSGKASCKAVYKLDVSADSSLVYIRPVPVRSRASQTDAININDHSSLVVLASTGIQLNFFEKAAVVLYWDRAHKKIEEIQTED